MYTFHSCSQYLHTNVILHNSFKKWANPGIYFVYFCYFYQQFYRKIVYFRGIRTRIVGVEGEHADHLTTTTAPLSQLFSVLFSTNHYRTCLSNVLPTYFLSKLSREFIQSMFSCKMETTTTYGSSDLFIALIVHAEATIHLELQ